MTVDKYEIEEDEQDSIKKTADLLRKEDKGIKSDPRKYKLRFPLMQYGFIECEFEGFNTELILAMDEISDVMKKSGFGAESAKPTVTSEPTEEPQERPSNGTSVVCPKCGGPTWDNRESKWYDAAKRQPTHKCKDKVCGGAVWVK